MNWNEKQFEIFSNDKRKFKNECIKYGVPTPKMFAPDKSLKKEDLFKIEYPVMLKPSDSSGGRGIKRCENENELLGHYKFLYNNISKNIVCEKYIQSNNEIFLHYTVQNGEPSLSASFLKYFNLNLRATKYLKPAL